MSGSYFKLRMIKKKHLKDKNWKGSLVNKSKGTCRICLKDGSLPIFATENSFDIPEAIRLFGGIDVNEKESYPRHLCDSCHSLLQGAVLFRKSAQDTDIKLRQITMQKGPPLEPPEIDKTNQYFKLPKVYKCKNCRITFGNYETFMKHKNSQHHKKLLFLCPICNKLLTPKLYKTHLKNHDTTDLVCDICGKMFRKDNLMRHLFLHKFELPYQCQICPYKGRFRQSLEIHMRTHTGEKPYACDKCDLRFITRSNLNRHLFTHTKDRPFKCIECGRGFLSERDMDVHFRSDHVGIKDFVCNICGNKYGTQKAMSRHELRVHKRQKMAKGKKPLYLRAEFKDSVLT